MFGPARNGSSESVILSVKAALLAAVITGIASLAAGNRYTSVAHLLPLSRQSSLSGSLPALQMISGVNLSGNSLDVALPQILAARTTLEKVMKKEYQFQIATWRFGALQPRKMTLEAFLAAANHDVAIERLKNFVEFVKDFKSGVIEIRVTLPSADLAKQVNDELVTSLDEFLRQNRKERAGQTAQYTQLRVAEARVELGKALDALVSFADRNRNYMVSPDPKARVQGARLEADVDFCKQKLVRLMQQTEMAIFEERDSTTVISVLDPASLPIQKSGPSRAKWVLAAFFGTLLVGIVYANRDQIWANQTKA